MERFGGEKCLGMQITGTKEERLLAMIEVMDVKPLYAISIKSAHRIRPVGASHPATVELDPARDSIRPSS